MIYGHQLIKIFDLLYALGLTTSRSSFSIRWCGMGEDLMRDYARREGATARVAPRVVMRLRERLKEAASLLPADLAAQVHEIDKGIARDIRIANILGRRSISV